MKNNSKTARRNFKMAGLCIERMVDYLQNCRASGFPEVTIDELARYFGEPQGDVANMISEWLDDGLFMTMYDESLRYEERWSYDFRGKRMTDLVFWLED